MLTDERRAVILDRLRTQGRVLATDLSAELDVSQDTIRRDLRELDGLGLLRRVHGGALPRHGDASPFAAPPRASATGRWWCSTAGPPRSSLLAPCATT